MIVSAIDAVHKISLYRLFVETQYDLNVITFEDVEVKTTHYHYEHVSNLHDESNHILTGCKSVHRVLFSKVKFA